MSVVQVEAGATNEAICRILTERSALMAWGEEE
jgi:hypothetical protein